MTAAGRKRYVILDRDGTINVEREYLSNWTQVELIANAALGLKKMRALGLGLVVVTNQSGIARGYFDEADLLRIHDRLAELLRNEGAYVDRIYHCPHAPDAGCQCRKPVRGLVDRAATDLGFDPAQSFVIGDKPCDIDLGRAVGAKTILVRSGYGRKFEQSNVVAPDFIVDDLVQAAVVLEGAMNC